MIIMRNYVYKGKYYNVRELSELSGVKYSTLCERLKNGYSVEEAIALDTRIPDSILEFDSASDYKDWDGMINEELYGDYRQWCSNNDFFPESHIHFTKCIKRIHPNIRVVPSRLKKYDGVVYKRVIRVDYFEKYDE